MIPRRLAVVVNILIAAVLGAAPARSHDHPDAADVARAKQDGTYEARMRRIRQWAPHRMSAAIEEKAKYKVERDSLRAQGLSPEQVGAQLFGGRRMAFPYSALPELRASGAVKTLTILVDFADHMASKELPGMTSTTVARNIYGSGPPPPASYRPFESVNGYYARASQGKVDVQGSVLGWYHFPKKRAQYEPTAPGEAAENQAIFAMAKEAMTSYDATHDFAQYDNDGDGDIDLVTILYAGPDTGWGNFWWAYRWQFTVPDAATTEFDKKRLRQFVFQFVNSRPEARAELDPHTLIHEMGHSFGLADYYDYDDTVGPSGGVGGADIMDANRGNHGAFSRWLLDWIQPTLIGSDPPSKQTLVASTSAIAGVKAVAIFPHATNRIAPDREMFIVENRTRVPDGNDAGVSAMPGDGLLVWHVDARPRSDNSGFMRDNSYSAVKLISLIRADNAADFGANDHAGAGTYFLPPLTLTPTTVPSSNSSDGKPTGVSITDISPAGEVMTATMGILPGPGAAAAGVAAGGVAPQLTSGPAPPAAAGAAGASSVGLDVDRMEQLLATLQSASPETIAAAWSTAVAKVGVATPSRDTSVTLQTILAVWAAKDGSSAVQATLQLTNPDLRKEAFPRVMEAWAAGNPDTADAWYFKAEQASLRQSPELFAGERFAARLYEWKATKDIDAAVHTLAQLGHPTEVWGAARAVESIAVDKGIPEDQVRAKIDAVPVHGDTMKLYRQLKDALELLDKSVKDPGANDRMRELMRERIEPEAGALMQLPDVTIDPNTREELLTIMRDAAAAARTPQNRQR